MNEEQFKAEVHRLHNAYLVRHGGKPRKRHPALDKAADWFAGEMAAGRAPFGHGNWTARLKRFLGRRTFQSAALAENIAYGQDNPQEVVNAWIKSRDHERNMRNKKLRRVGYGFAVRGDTEYWVVNFGTF